MASSSSSSFDSNKKAIQDELEKKAADAAQLLFSCFVMNCVGDDDGKGPVIKDVAMLSIKNQLEQYQDDMASGMVQRYFRKQMNLIGNDLKAAMNKIDLDQITRFIKEKCDNEEVKKKMILGLLNQQQHLMHIGYMLAISQHIGKLPADMKFKYDDDDGSSSSSSSSSTSLVVVSKRKRIA